MRGTRGLVRGVVAGGLGIAALAGLGMPAGCAVTTIDVDVYKGPLANERQVQIQEAAMLAMGAKPLLKQLRDDLEVNALGRDLLSANENIKSYRVAVDTCTSNSVKYKEWNSHRDNKYAAKPDWASGVAKRANAVLSLYDDLPSEPELVSPAKELKAAIDQCDMCDSGDKQSAAAGALTAALKAAQRFAGDETTPLSIRDDLGNAIEKLHSPEGAKLSLLEIKGWARDDEASNRAALREAIAEHPAEQSEKLLALDRSMQAKQEVDAPTKAVLKTISARLAASDFEWGRPSRGLDWMIHQFANSKLEPPQDEQGVPVRKRVLESELQDALLQFAEKTLYLANYSALVDGNEDPPPYKWPVEALSDLVRSRRLTPEELANRHRIFEAVGNAILVQINELQAWENADSVQARRLKGAMKENSDAGYVKNLDHPRPKDVMDAVIVRIEADLREAIEDGEPAEKVNSLRAALAEAHDQRSRMVYIRPPSFYLKNSYPVASLQSSTQGPWKNMLAEQAWRGVPWINTWMYRTDDVMTQRKIDRLYWQNINRVRVAASGITNYVIAKDAVGNWYVKNYSGDPSPIIKAAKAAAMMGAGMPNIYASADRKEQGAEAPGRAKTIVGNQRAYFEKQYKQDTAEDRARLGNIRDLVTATDSKGLSSQLKSMPNFGDLGFASVDELTPSGWGSEVAAAATEAGKLDTNSDQQVFVGLAKAEQLYQQLVGKIGRAKGRPAGSTTETAAEKESREQANKKARDDAKQLVDQQLGRPLIKAIDRRLESLDRYRTGLRVIAESTSTAAK